MSIRFLLVSIIICMMQVSGGIAAPDGDLLPQDRYEARMSFRPTLLGSVEHGREDVQLRPGGDYREAFVIIQYPDPPFHVDPQPGQRGDTIPINGRSVDVFASFAPTRSGEWRDSIVMVRYTPFDRIVVRLYGVGVSASRTADVNFGEVLTGDTVRRAVLMPREIVEMPNTIWQIAAPKPPFDILTRNGPRRINNDSAGLIFEFGPMTEGRSSETVTVLRKREDGVILDSLICKLVGVGRQMPKSRTVTADDVVTGSTTVATEEIDLPIAPRSLYEYALVALDNGPVEGMVTQPKVPSTSTRITTQFSCSPLVTGSYQRTFSLRRLHRGRAIDSTLITVQGRATRPPDPKVVLRAGFADAAQTVRIGDTVRLPVVADVQSSSTTVSVALTSMQCTVSYNPSILVPISSPLATFSGRSSANDVQLATFNVERSAGDAVSTGDTIMAIAFIAVLGDDDRSDVAIAAAAYRLASGAAEDLADSMTTRAATTVILGDAWQHAGGQRRVNTLQGPLDIVVEPNPIDVEATLRVVNVPTNVGRLVIVDAMGRIVADLSAALQAGTTTFTLGASSGADVVITPGSYYARLAVRGVDGDTLNSVVRLVVMR
ncbi:MAG: hypothetical protein FGM24_00815 [Candidatus Kapabacteria bacterium]|nr:hypothetical protein [Candidatus Kapabacteria bacterium]